jgi:methylamine---glutamate N-methyltransferase subunit A
MSWAGELMRESRAGPSRQDEPSAPEKGFLSVAICFFWVNKPRNGRRERRSKRRSRRGGPLLSPVTRRKPGALIYMQHCFHGGKRFRRRSNPQGEGENAVCGVVGLLVKDEELEGELGALLVPMLTALGDRGPDSSGLAIYTRAEPGVHRVSFGSDRPVDWTSFSADLDGQTFPVVAGRVLPSGVTVDVPEESVPALVDYVSSAWPDVRLLGTGAGVTVVKDTGRPEVTCERHGVASWNGYLAIGHTRMATESAVTVLHSHPFAPSPGLCVVHNGSYSNYASVRRSLVADGARFDSENDSEVAARFLAARLEEGDDLDRATRSMATEMDGFFTLVVTTGQAMSVVRDAFACKPAVVAETDGFVAVASEYRALAGLPGIESAEVFEPQPEEVYTWNC